MSDDGRCTAKYLAWRCEGRVAHYGYHHFGHHHFGVASRPKDPTPPVPVGPTKEGKQ